jgi:hypothetical protein
MTTELTFPIVTPTGFPYGVRCTDCDRDLLAGDPYTDRAYSMCGNDMVTEIVCFYCANSGAA